MKRTCIAVVDATRARMFTYERVSGLEGTREHLIEHVDLVNPARRLRPSELLSESRPGSSRTGGLQYTLDDHRDAHLDELDQAHARAAIAEIEKLVDGTRASRLILCASPSLLGLLREHAWPAAVEVVELARDYAKLTPAQLRDHLTTHELLPPKPRRPGLTSPPGH